MIKLRFYLPLALSWVIGSGCSDKLPDYSQLSTLRVLAIQASTPEVSDTGATVTLTPWISDINGSGRDLQYSYQACIDPGIRFGAQPSCGESFNVPVPLTAIGATRHTYTGAAPHFNITLPTGVLTSGALISATQQFNGIAYLVVYRLQSSDGKDTVTAFKRIIVSTNPTKNKNPTINSVLSENASLTLVPATSPYPAAKAKLSVTMSPDSQETYQVSQTDGSQSSSVESISLTWFYSDGTTQLSRTFPATPNEWTLPSPLPSARSAVIVVVAHDGRGGIDVQQVEFR